VEIISRDRGLAYIDGATRGAPTATQVADSWHLLQNLREALERLLEQHRECLCATASLPGTTNPEAPTPRPDTDSSSGSDDTDNAVPPELAKNNAGGRRASAVWSIASV